jgi:hypothetical protein
VKSIRVASLALVITILFAPLPAHAQGNGVNARVAALEEAVAALQAAVTTLQNNINAEASARAAADTTLQANIDNETAARAAADTALDARLAKLEGNITASDLEGTYTVSLVGISIDPFNFSLPNRIGSYAIKGTATINAGGSGTLAWTLDGVLMSERAAALTCSLVGYLGERPDDRLAERRHIVRLARGDQVAVLDDRLVHVETAGVLDIDRNRRPAGERPPAQRDR